MWLLADLRFTVTSQNEKTTLLGKTKQEYVRSDANPQSL